MTCPVSPAPPATCVCARARACACVRACVRVRACARQCVSVPLGRCLTAQRSGKLLRHSSGAALAALAALAAIAATRCNAELSACSYGTWKGYFGFQEFSYK